MMSGNEGQGFVHLRVRSAYSLLEGAIKADKIGPGRGGRACRRRGHRSQQPVRGAGIFRLFQGLRGPADHRLRPGGVGVGAGPTERWARTPTITLLVQNERGYLNLSELSSLAYLESGEMDEPVVPWAKVVEHAEGLILLSGGTDGPVDALLAAGKTAEGEAALAEMQRVFGDRFYVELQRHGLPRQAAAEPGWSTGPMSTTRRWSPPTTSITPSRHACTTPTTPCCASPTAPSSARTSAGG
jgi:DNA polymerase-3 subunit alpha